MPTPEEIANEVTRAAEVATATPMDPETHLATAEEAIGREVADEDLTAKAARLSSSRGHLDALPEDFETRRVRTARRALDAQQRELEREALSIARTCVEGGDYDLARAALAFVPDGSRSARDRDRLTTRIERAEARAAELAAVRGPRPTVSPWNGAALAVSSYLRLAANDPDSIEIVACGDLYTDGNFWTQDCAYRGSNAFGATVLNSTRFFIQHEAVARTRRVRSIE